MANSPGWLVVKVYFSNFHKKQKFFQIRILHQFIRSAERENEPKRSNKQKLLFASFSKKCLFQQKVPNRFNIYVFKAWLSLGAPSHHDPLVSQAHLGCHRMPHCFKNYGYYVLHLREENLFVLKHLLLTCIGYNVC
jgi:hypothetical protein